MPAMWITVALLACGRDCASELDLVERDWCYAEQAIHSAEAGNLSRSRTLVTRIDGDLAQAAAVEAVLTVSPRRVELSGVQDWCGMLGSPFDQRCLHNRGVAR